MIRKYTRTIDASIDTCFGTVIGRDRVQKWMGGDMVTEYPMLAEDAMVGVPYKLTYANFWELNGEITAYKKPTDFAVSFTSNVAGTQGRFAYKFKELEPNKTEVTFELELIDDNMARKAAVNMLLGKIDEASTSHLETVKQVAESKVSQSNLPK